MWKQSLMTHTFSFIRAQWYNRNERERILLEDDFQGEYTSQLAQIGNDINKSYQKEWKETNVTFANTEAYVNIKPRTGILLI